MGFLQTLQILAKVKKKKKSHLMFKHLKFNLGILNLSLEVAVGVPHLSSSDKWTSSHDLYDPEHDEVDIKKMDTFYRLIVAALLPFYRSGLSSHRL